MKISVNKLGFIEEGCIETNDLTIIFGPNNVGKTYLSYSIYSSLSEYVKSFDGVSVVTDKMIEDLLNSRSVELFCENVFLIPEQEEISTKISKNLSKFFKDTTGTLSNASIKINNEHDLFKMEDKSFHWTLQLMEGPSLVASKVSQTNLLKLSLLEVSSEIANDVVIERESLKNQTKYLLDFIAKKDIFKELHINPFIITSERTGISVFLKDIDHNRNEVINEMAYESLKTVNRKVISSLLKGRVSNFSEPINNNINTIRGALNEYNTFNSDGESDSFISIIKAFDDLACGKYKVVNDEIYFTMNKNDRNIELPIPLASSAGKSLFLFDLYIKKNIKTNKYLIIDEPELNLHPISQIKMARLLVRLINYGVKIIITTHSDFMIKEINNRIMAKELNDNKVNSELGYEKFDLIDKSKVNAFTISNNGIIEKIDVDEYGVSSELFDKAIVEVEARNEELIYKLAKVGELNDK